MKVWKSIAISAPPEKIWPFLVEPDKILKWCTTFRKFEYTGEQRSGVGTPFYLEEKAGPMPLMKLNFTVKDWAENNKIAFSLSSGAGTRGYDQSWTIEATPSGSKFTFFEEFKFPSPIAEVLLGPVARRMSSATVKGMLARLKNMAEA